MVVFDVSFQLSCVATFAVIFAAPPVIEKYGPYLKFLPQKFKIRDTMLGTAVIEIFLLPILLSTSGKISLVTVVTNLLVLPLLPIVMGFGFAATLIGYVHNLLALPLVALSNLMLEYILLVTAVVATVILFTQGSGNLFQSRLSNVFNQSTQDLLNVANRLSQ